MQHPVEGKKLKDYRVNAEGKLTLDDKPVETTLSVKPLEKPESFPAASPGRADQQPAFSAQG